MREQLLSFRVSLLDRASESSQLRLREEMATLGACLRQIGLLDTSVFTACDNIDEEFKIVKKTYHKTILQCVPALPAFCGGKGRLTCMLRPLFTASSTVTRTEILRRY